MSDSPVTQHQVELLITSEGLTCAIIEWILPRMLNILGIVRVTKVMVHSRDD
jgi:hypothetical protein